MAKNRLLPSMNGAFTEDMRLIANHNFPDISLCDTQLDRTSSTTLTNISGMVTDTLVAGATYTFRAVIPTVCTANNGSKFAFKFGAASMISAIEYEARAFTASGVPTVSRGTTATDQALLLDNATGVIIHVEITGVVVIDNTAALQAAQAAGTLTLQLQAGQHTSHSDTTSVFKYAQMSFQHITTG